MIKIAKNIVLVSILSLVMIGCSSSNSGTDNYFGYNNEPDPPEREQTGTSQGYAPESGGSGYYEADTQAEPSYTQPVAAQSYTVYQYYDYYDPYYDTPFIPWRLSYMDRYAYSSGPGVSIYVSNRPYWWYDQYEPWRFYDYNHYYNHYVYNNYGYHPYNHYHWSYYRRYYNPYDYSPKYISNDRKDSRNTMRGFGPSRGTYSGGADGGRKSSTSTVRGTRPAADSRTEASEGWEGLYDDNYRNRSGNRDSDVRTGRTGTTVRGEDVREARPTRGAADTRTGNFRTPERREEYNSPDNNRRRSNNQAEYERSRERSTYTAPPSRTRYSSPSESSNTRSTRSSGREYRRSSGSRGESYSSPSRNTRSSSTRSSGSSSSRSSSGSGSSESNSRGR